MERKNKITPMGAELAKKSPQRIGDENLWRALGNGTLVRGIIVDIFKTDKNLIRRIKGKKGDTGDQGMPGASIGELKKQVETIIYPSTKRTKKSLGSALGRAIGMIKRDGKAAQNAKADAEKAARESSDSAKQSKEDADKSIGAKNVAEEAKRLAEEAAKKAKESEGAAKTSADEAFKNADFAGRFAAEARQIKTDVETAKAETGTLLAEGRQIIADVRQLKADATTASTNAVNAAADAIRTNQDQEARNQDQEERNRKMKRIVIGTAILGGVAFATSIAAILVALNSNNGTAVPMPTQIPTEVIITVNGEDPKIITLP